MALRKKQHNHRWNRKQPIEHTGFFPYLQRYLEALLIRGFSQETHTRHDSHIRRFAVWSEERDLNGPKEITKPILERYQKHLYYYRKTNGDPLSFNSQQVMLSSLKQFFKWLTQENYLLYNPASELQLPKPPRKIPRTILSPESISDLINQPDTDTPDGMRDRVIMELFYSSGLRRTELANLKIYDIDMKRQVLVVREGKGGKDRMLPIGERANAWLEKYLEDVREELTSPLDEERLFITDYGEPFNGGLLGRLVKKYMKQTGIDVLGSCHLFRHAMATHMLENGADIRFIQAMLGHDDLNSTEIYTRVTVEKLREIHHATHPARLNKPENVDESGSVHPSSTSK
jgi:integrase/recombinase XerD